MKGLATPRPLKLFWLFVSILLLAACNQATQPSITSTSTTNDALLVPEYAPSEPGEIRSVEINGETFTYRVVDGLVVVEGDMILGTVEEVEAKIEEVRNGSLLAQSFGATDWFGNYKYWPDGKIYYAYETNLSSQQRADLDRAIERWRDTTMLRFYSRGTGPRIVFRRATDSGDCSSEVGYPGAEGITFTNLGTRCGYPETLHEIGHAVALNHEHTRCDRDKYIVVYTSRMSGEGNNVSKNCSTGAQLSTRPLAKVDT